MYEMPSSAHNKAPRHCHSHDKSLLRELNLIIREAIVAGVLILFEINFMGADVGGEGWKKHGCSTIAYVPSFFSLSFSHRIEIRLCSSCSRL